MFILLIDSWDHLFFIWRIFLILKSFINYLFGGFFNIEKLRLLFCFILNVVDSMGIKFWKVIHQSLQDIIIIHMIRLYMILFKKQNRRWTGKITWGRNIKGVVFSKCIKLIFLMGILLYLMTNRQILLILYFLLS